MRGVTLETTSVEFKNKLTSFKLQETSFIMKLADSMLVELNKLV